jgi:hypothetical protein
MAAAILAGLGLVIVLLGARSAGPALGQGTTVRVVSPGTASVGDTVAVEIRIDNVPDPGLGAYEWILTYDPNVLELAPAPNPVDGSFLGSTGSPVSCPAPLTDVGTVRFGCGSTASLNKPRPTGSGLLSTVSFKALATGSSSLCLSSAVLADADANDIPTGVANASIAVGGGSPPPPSCAPAATATPVTPPPDYTPPALTETPVSTPGPTATPVPLASPTPPGPTPTPAPTPPPEQSDWVELAAVCNPTASTYPDGTTVQTLAAAISPPDILSAMWAFQDGLWLGYSPLYPEASNLATRNFLDVVFLCVDAVGTFVRPLV